MKIWVPLITTLLTLSITGCFVQKSKTHGSEKVCAMYYAMNGAVLSFDGTPLTGKQFKVMSNGQLVFDTCQGGSMDLGEMRYYFADSHTSPASIKRLSEKTLPLPASETFEILSRATCTDPDVSIGTASVTYHFGYQADATNCQHDYYSDFQDIVFH